ncbi:MAG: molybdopterin-dependent oxidoreductase, partial [Phycisphaerales bacterium]|nr:molybdopterin-dependent oxidoreductase [Phycisphaerales bacterium]
MKDWLELNRREFLAALGAAYGTAAWACAAPHSWFLEYSAGKDGPPTERFVNTLCSMCPGGCGLRVRVVHGCAVGVRGNKDHPINRGGLCSRASAVLQDVYNPDRLQQPLKNAGERGSGQWATLEWDAATGLFADKLRQLRASGRPEGLCVLLGRDRGLSRTAWRRFAQAYGTPNVIDVFPDDNFGALPAVLATHGVRQRIGYDLAASAYVLSLSSGWLDAHWSTEQAARAFAEFRRGRPGFRPQWVHAEPRFSLTAAKADEWIPIRPGAEGAMALGIAHVMVREGLYDRDFVEQHGYGFDDWVDGDGREHMGFRRLVLKEYAPSTVQEMTGVPEGTIFRLAREFSSNRPAVAIGFDGGGCDAQATHNRMAIHALNALAGSIDVPGGVTVFRELTVLENDFEVDSVADQGLAAPRLDGAAAQHRLCESAVDLLADSIEHGRPYKVEAVVLVDADPVFALAEGRRLEAALSKVPFVVALTAYHNDSSRHADLVLPLLHSFHRWDFNVAHTLTGYPVFTISQPAMDAPPASRDPYEALRAVAERLGDPVKLALPWANSRSA